MYRIFIGSLWLLVLSLIFPVWPLELLVSFMQYMIAIGLLLLAFFMYRKTARSPSIAFAILPLMISLVFPLQSWVTNTEVHTDQDAVTLYTHNMLYNTANEQEVAAQARANSADIVALQEVLPDQIETVRQELSFRDVYMSDCDCSVNEDELALVTRYPIIEAETVNVDIRGGQIINVRLDVEGSPLRVFVVHLPVPIVPSTYATRERGFARLSELLESVNEPVVIMGDFNTTQWSPSLRRFSASNERLVNVVNNGSSAISWCDRFVSLACLRIDHVFVDTQIEILSSEVGLSSGSDHRAIITMVKL